MLYASTFVGDFQAFAHLRVGGRPRGDRQLQDLIEEIVRIGLSASTGGDEDPAAGRQTEVSGLIVLTHQVDPGADIEGLATS